MPPEAWQVGPWNRWAYQHVGEMVATVPVPRGDGPRWELPEAPEALGGLELADAAGRPRRLGDLLDELWVDGIAAVRDGALVFERYRNGMTPATRHVSQSVAKSVLGLLVGVLAGRGALDPAAPVSEHVPEVAGSGYAGATVRHLLDMTAAVDFVEDYDVDFWRYDVACGWHPPRPGAEHGSILEYLPGIGPAARRHGEALHYASPNTDLLGIVAERAAGAPLAEVLSRELWQPMGAEHDAELAVDPAGTAVISGGFCATLRDYARLGALTLGGGVGRMVPADWLAGLGEGDEDALRRCTDPALVDGVSGYGRQWWRRDGRIVARGIHGQLVAAEPETGMVVTILSSWPTATDTAADLGQRRIVQALGAALGPGGANPSST